MQLYPKVLPEFFCHSAYNFYFCLWMGRFSVVCQLGERGLCYSDTLSQLHRVTLDPVAIDTKCKDWGSLGIRLGSEWSGPSQQHLVIIQECWDHLGSIPRQVWHSEIKSRGMGEAHSIWLDSSSQCFLTSAQLWGRLNLGSWRRSLS